jgi:hypothetical protein
MSKQKSIRAQTRPSRPSGYPVEAIRDFFDHLLVHVQASHFEQCYSGACDDDLGDRLGHYMMKYGVALLPIVTYQAGPGVSPEAVNTWLTSYRAKLKAEREEQLRHLEALRPLVELALETAQRRLF